MTYRTVERMVAEDNRRGIAKAGRNILKRLNLCFENTDTLPASVIYEHPPIAYNVEPELCCRILIGLWHLEAPYEPSCREGELYLTCEYDDTVREDEFTDIMDWIVHNEPAILDAAEDAPCEVYALQL
jgi:hypothetical protein